MLKNVSLAEGSVCRVVNGPGIVDLAVGPDAAQFVRLAVLGRTIDERLAAAVSNCGTPGLFQEITAGFRAVSADQ